MVCGVRTHQKYGHWVYEFRQEAFIENVSTYILGQGHCATPGIGQTSIAHQVPTLNKNYGLINRLLTDEQVVDR